MFEDRKIKIIIDVLNNSEDKNTSLESLKIYDKSSWRNLKNKRDRNNR